jgi:hypothetical protein
VLRRKNAVVKMVPAAKRPNVPKPRKQNVLRRKNVAAKMAPAVSRNSFEILMIFKPRLTMDGAFFMN